LKRSAKIRVSELQRVGEQFNRLARSLSRTEADNRLLIDRLMSIQESERKDLARELHDEFGASLFGIRASVSCIVQAATAEGTAELRFTEIAERAHSISSLADRVQKQNYRILERIRPIAIDEMGLFNSIRHLADGWSATRRVVCHITTPETEPKLGSEESLAIYRIVQECLTNIARHSSASRIEIKFEVSTDRCLIVRVADDGSGLPDAFRPGFGILGMMERARKLNGNLKVSNGDE
jgi:two-component system, NarL family, sensor histidine kinase UhpB